MYVLSPTVDVGVALAPEVVGVEHADVAAGTTQEQALDSFEALAEHWETNVGSAAATVEDREESVYVAQKEET